ncbi:MAG: ABC transporter ATP-binding protein [Saprospiraceae bacterium]|nr:MAG: ABC transporter ATP-binding protein [Saprospiraceae bacterium]
MPENLLTINNLHVHFPTEAGTVEAVRGISFSLKKGETLGIVGESGSGKSVTALSILGLLPAPGIVAGGEIHFAPKDGEPVDLAKLPERQFQKIRGGEIAMIFQEPMTSLNPVFRCGEQVAEAIRLHHSVGNEEAKRQVLALFEKAKLPEPERIYRAYPHQLSGGQIQRVMIAMALSGNPSLLIADEHTSALDVSVQAAILGLLNELKTGWGGSTIFISHNLAVVAQVASRVLVMKAGEIVEQGRVGEVFNKPQHLYTRELVLNSGLSSVHSPQFAVSSPQSAVRSLAGGGRVMLMRELKTWFPAAKNFFGKAKSYVKAVDGVTLEILPGETLGLAGESGSGKTTLGRSLLFLQKPTSGEVFYGEQNLARLTDGKWKALRKDLQIIFQDPYSSLNPRLPIGLALTEPMRVHGILSNEKERRQRAVELLETVGLEAGHFWRYPNEFSGGQRQRICIARALALEPRFIVCDECVSALDVTVQAQVLNLLMKLKNERGLTYLFISHDLAVVRAVSDRIAVMKDGKIVELGATEEVYTHPKCAYTKQLLDAIPKGTMREF